MKTSYRLITTSTLCSLSAGVWETSGILDAEHLFGRDSWLFNVQAHPRRPSLPLTRSKTGN